MEPDPLQAEMLFNPQSHICLCKGDWSILHVDAVLQQIDALQFPEKNISLNGKDITVLDSAGALALLHFIERGEKAQCTVQLVDFDAKQEALLQLLKSKQVKTEPIKKPRVRHNAFYLLGKETFYKLGQIEGLVVLIGQLTDKLFAAAGSWKRFQLPSLISNVQTAGIQALPIIALLSFLIGVVLAYQMGLQLETYGANGFIAYLCGMACFREFAPLITAIIVAGRTSSSFTAQIGSMKLNEEIDAIETMGLSPIELLVLPKLLGLLFIFPLLIFWSDLFSILGAMLLSKFKLGIGYVDFLHKLTDSVGAKQFMLGLYKAPTFAILIALVGCFQGFNVKANASSIGSQTTKSVVQALFLIIIADAIYSVIYSWLHL